MGSAEEFRNLLSGFWGFGFREMDRWGPLRGGGGMSNSDSGWGLGLAGLGLWLNFGIVGLSVVGDDFWRWSMVRLASASVVVGRGLREDLSEALQIVCSAGSFLEFFDTFGKPLPCTSRTFSFIILNF